MVHIHLKNIIKSHLFAYIHTQLESLKQQSISNGWSGIKCRLAALSLGETLKRWAEGQQGPSAVQTSAEEAGWPSLACYSSTFSSQPGTRTQIRERHLYASSVSDFTYHIFSESLINLDHVFGHVLHYGLQVGLTVGGVVFLCWRLENKRIKKLAYCWKKPWK